MKGEASSTQDLLLSNTHSHMYTAEHKRHSEWHEIIYTTGLCTFVLLKYINRHKMRLVIYELSPVNWHCVLVRAECIHTLREMENIPAWNCSKQK